MKLQSIGLQSGPQVQTDPPATVTVYRLSFRLASDAGPALKHIAFNEGARAETLAEGLRMLADELERAV